MGSMSTKQRPPKVINYQSQIFKIATLIDGGVRLTLDLIDPSSKTILDLFDAKQPGIIIESASVVIKTKPEIKTNAQKAEDHHRDDKRSKRYPYKD